MTPSPETPAENDAAVAALHPLLQRLVQQTGARVLQATEVDAWAREGGVAMLVFSEEPERYKETLDLAVVVPELHAHAGRSFRVGLLPPVAARAAAPRYGFARWPAFVMLRDGQYLGAVDGVRDWDVYTAELARLMSAAPSRAPSVGIPVNVAGASADPHCH